MEPSLPYYEEEKSRWKWLVLFGSFLSHSITWGLAYAAGIFQVIFMDAFGGPGKAGMIAIIPTLIVTCLTFVGLVSSVLTNRFGHVKVGWTGTLVAFSGLLLSSVATSIWFLYVTFCLIGIGFGLQYLPSVTVLCQYFTKRRPMALGLASSGAPAGTFFMAPLIRILTTTYGWRGTFLILAAISLNIGVASSLFRPITLPQPHRSQQEMVEWKKRKRKVIRVKILRQPSFICLLVNNLTLIFGFSSFYMHLPAYMKSIGVSEDLSAVFVSVCGAAGIVSRLVSAQGVEQLEKSLGLYNFLMSVSALCVMISPFLNSTVLISVNCAFFGLFSSTMGSLMPLVITELVGQDAMSDGYGYILVAEGVGSLLGPPISGFIYDGTNSYVGALCLAGSVAIFGSLIMLASQAVDNCGAKSTTEQSMFRNLSVSSGDSGFLDEDLEKMDTLGFNPTTEEKAATISENTPVSDEKNDVFKILK